jgi:uncharacterized protein (DUF58 family)
MLILYQGHQTPRWVGWLLAIPLLMLAAVFGLVVLAAVLGLVLLGALVLGVQVWRVKRRLRRVQASQVLEGEYITVRESRRDRPSP